MRTVSLILLVCLLAIISIASAQNPVDAVAGSIQEHMNAAGQQLQQKTVQHVLEGNLTEEHISSELNATKENLTEQVRDKINQEIDESKNLTPEQIKQKAEEELNKRLAQQQPGFEVTLALLACLGAVSLIRRRN